MGVGLRAVAGMLGGAGPGGFYFTALLDGTDRLFFLPSLDDLSAGEVVTLPDGASSLLNIGIGGTNTRFFDDSFYTAVNRSWRRTPISTYQQSTIGSFSVAPRAVSVARGAIHFIEQVNTQPTDPGNLKLYRLDNPNSVDATEVWDIDLSEETYPSGNTTRDIRFRGLAFAGNTLYTLMEVRPSGSGQSLNRNLYIAYIPDITAGSPALEFGPRVFNGTSSGLSGSGVMRAPIFYSDGRLYSARQNLNVLYVDDPQDDSSTVDTLGTLTSGLGTLSQPNTFFFTPV